MGTDENVMPGTADRWDSKYSEKPEEWFFGREPSELARLTMQFWRQIRSDERGPALDLGCGEGRDAVYLTRNGFEVTAVDSSTVALAKMERLASESGIRIAAVCNMDAGGFDIGDRFGLIFSHNCLQFLGSACVPTLHRLQQATPEGGFNAVSVFTRDSEQLADRPDIYRFDSNELKFYYRGWRLLYYSEDLLWREPAGIHLSFARIIAYKPESG